MHRLFLSVSSLALLAALPASPVLAACSEPNPGEAGLEIGDNEQNFLFAPSVTLDGTLYGLYAGDGNTIATRDDDGAVTAGDTDICLRDDNNFEGGFVRGFSAGAIAEIGDLIPFRSA